MLNISAVLAVASLVVVMPATLTIWTTPRLLVAAVAAMLGAIYQTRRDVTHDTAWSLFGVCFFFSLITSIDPSMSLLGQYYAGVETGLFMVMLYLLMGNAIGVDVKKITVAIAIFGTATAVYVIMQRLGIDPMPWNVAKASGREAGLMGQPAWSGLLIAMTVPFLLGLLDESPAWAIGLLWCATGLMLTGSRGAMMAAVLAAVWHYRKHLSGKTKLAVLSCAGLAILYMGYHGWRGDIMRLEQNRLALKAWLSHPWLGWGPGTGALWFLRMRDASTAGAMGADAVIQVHSHNWTTNVLASQGLLGLIGWGSMALYCWCMASSAVRGALLVVGLFGMFNPIPPVVYIVMAVAVGSCVDVINTEPMGKIRRWATIAAAYAVFVIYVFGFGADLRARKAHVFDGMKSGNESARAFLTSASLAPWEFYYPARAATALPNEPELAKKVMRAAIKSAKVHRYNPMAIASAAVSMQLAGKPKSALAAAKYAMRLDPMRNMHTAR